MNEAQKYRQDLLLEDIHKQIELINCKICSMVQNIEESNLLLVLTSND